VFLWKTLIGNLNDFQYLIYYAVLRTLESVVSIGAFSVGCSRLAFALPARFLTLS